MNEKTRQMLFEKNRRIIEAVKHRAELVCPGALDMIAVTGSFASGDFHERSDLDLLIVIGDERGNALSHCFVLDDVGYDLYCHTWDRLEQEAEYSSPYVSKLLDAQIVYCRDESVNTRFHTISDRLQQHLDGPLTADDYSHAQKLTASAKISYFDAAAAGTDRYRYPLIGILHALECAVYLLNHAVVRHGVHGICAELAAMPSLPDDFIRLHTALYGEGTYEQHIACAGEMIVKTERWLSGYRDCVCPRSAICAETLCGTYEELYSNYQNKLIYASEQNGRYLSQKTLASAQLFFDEVRDSTGIPDSIGFDSSAYATPTSAEKAFLDAMKQYEAVYRENGMEICRYADITSFEKRYCCLK